MNTRIAEVSDMLSVLTVDEVEKRIGEVPGVESVAVDCDPGREQSAQASIERTNQTLGVRQRFV